MRLIEEKQVGFLIGIVEVDGVPKNLWWETIYEHTKDHITQEAPLCADALPQLHRSWADIKITDDNSRKICVEWGFSYSACGCVLQSYEKLD